MSLREEAGRSTFPYRFVAFAIVSVVLAIGWFFFFGQNSAPASGSAKKTFVAKISDLRNSVEAEGRVSLTNVWALDFPAQWTVVKIHRKAGDSVKKDEPIAELDSTYLDIAVEKARIALALTEANYALKARASSDSDVKISEGQLESANASYESVASQSASDESAAGESLLAAKIAYSWTVRQAEISVMNAKSSVASAELDVRVASGNLSVTRLQETEKYENLRDRLVMESGQMVSALQKNLFDVDVLLGVSETNRHYNDAYEAYLSARSSSKRASAETAYSRASTAFAEFYSKWTEFRKGGNPEWSEIEGLSEELRGVASLTNQALSATVEVVKATVDSPSFNQAAINASLTSFENAQASLKTDSASYASTILSLREAKTAMDSKIFAAENALDVAEKRLELSVTNFRKSETEGEISSESASQKVSQAQLVLEATRKKKVSLLAKESAQVEISKIQADSKKFADPVELKPLGIAVESARNALEEALKRKKDSVLLAPADGKIASVAGTEGGSTASLKEPFATVISPGAFYVRSNVDEDIVPKVSSWQSSYVSFDVLDGLFVSWAVSFVGEKAEFDSNGVATYPVDVLFSTSDPRVREGMSSTVEFVTREKKGVLAIPVAAVRNVGWSASVTLSNGEVRKVKTGFTDAKMVEIVSGLSAGESVSY